MRPAEVRQYEHRVDAGELIDELLGGQPHSSRSEPSANSVEMAQQIGGIFIDPERPRLLQLGGAIATAEATHCVGAARLFEQPVDQTPDHSQLAGKTDSNRQRAGCIAVAEIRAGPWKSSNLLGLLRNLWAISCVLALRTAESRA
jgi:hypothetical protein